jgi:chemotaxis protein histidine kinase CheA/ActR/RegA family two-component response regulator
MTDDPTIREQSYHYFLQEAPELLQVLEQNLLDLRENYSTNKIHTLMRATHTLKGAAASIGLETIKAVAHSLEDIFKALFNPNLLIDATVEALLFECYECLRLPITAEITGKQINDTEILDRTAAIFAQLQEKLGNCFGEEAYIPSSVELGFDVTQSIFEVGVTQRLDEIAAVIVTAEPVAIAATVRTQAEIFQGLAESLNLPGFAAIAQAAIAALDAHPDRAVLIAETVLADFQAGQAAVLEGDRTQGGQPSRRLQQLAGFISSASELREEEGETEQNRLPSLEPSHHLISSLPHNATDSDERELVTPTELSWETSATDSELNEIDSHKNESVNPLLELIWGGEAVLDAQTSEQDSLPAADAISAATPPQENLNPMESEMLISPESADVQASSHASASDPINLSFSGVRDYGDNATIPTPEVSDPTSIPQKDRISQSHTVRIDVEHLERLNYSIGELLTNQNHQLLQNEQLKAAVRSLLMRLKQHEQRLSQLQDWSDRLSVVREQQGIGELGIGNWELGSRKIPSHPHNFIQNLSPPYQGRNTIHNRFDSLELDRYSDSQILVQLILEDAVQLAEAAEAIDLFTQQSNQTLEKQRRLLTNSRDALLEARMLPLGELFGRFPRVLQQLEALHHKPVTLELRGSEVLVDKVVADKLYGPLLHLVRNAFAHGIESPAIRQQWGKSQIGQIEISAYHQGKFLVIEVRDDGQGLDFEAIRQRAVERQFVSPERASSLNQAQLTDLLFEPGFSTAYQVSDLSGRGIGLDMVRAQLQTLQGAIAVDSEPYKGTTFILQIPLSLSIAKLLICQAGNQMYALLTNTIEQILIPQTHQLRCWEGGKVLRWGKGADEQLVPVHRLSDVLNYFSLLPETLLSPPKSLIATEEQELPIVLIRDREKLLGLEVDQLLGEQELVIRPLGEMIVPPAYVYGGSILADGRLTLVLDGAALMQCVLTKQAEESRVSLPIREQPSYAARDWASGAPHILPSHQQQRQLSGQIRAALPAAPEPDFRTRPSNRILVVDDSITLRQTLALSLQKAGYQVLQAKDGYEAIEQLRHQTDIQLVICDIEMPRMNGFEFLKYRQQDPALANIPIVILTSRSGEKHRLIAIELGATDYITKPFLEHNLLVTVTDVLKKNIFRK